MSKKIIIGNWKMNPGSLKEAEGLAKELVKITRGTKNATVVICPPAPYLLPLKKIFGKTISLGAQNTFFEMEGAYTGEVSPKILKSLGVSHVIIGHSERRTMGETDQIIDKKVLATLKMGLTPILCVGEKMRDPAHAYLQIIKSQLEVGLATVTKANLKKVIIAYEPVWALSSTENRKDVTAEDCAEIIIYIRKIIADMFGIKLANAARIIYGGSANAKDALALLTTGKAEGLLPGKASLNPKDFGGILKIVQTLK